MWMIGQMKNGGDGAQTRPRLLWLMNLRSQMVIYRFIFSEWAWTPGEACSQAYVYFLTSMNFHIKTAQILRLFFNKHELCAKTARILRLFFNEHELCAKTSRILHLFFNEHELCEKTARLTQSYDKSVSLRFYFLWSFISQRLLRILSLCKFVND